MSLTFCLLLIIIGFIWGRVRESYAATSLTIAGFALLVLIAIGVVPAMQLSATQLTNPLSDVAWHDKNAIVLLGAGTAAATKTTSPDVPLYAYGRVVATATAWRDCEAHGKDCAIVVSGGDPEHHGATEAAVYSRTLLALGVPAAAITLEDRSQNTWQNAVNSTRLVPTDRQIVVVTSGIHLKRSLVFFDHARPGAEGIAADRLAPSFGPLRAGYNLFVTDALLHEEIGLWQYHFYNLMGWNKPKVKTETPSRP